MREQFVLGGSFSGYSLIEVFIKDIWYRFFVVPCVILLGYNWGVGFWDSGWFFEFLIKKSSKTSKWDQM